MGLVEPSLLLPLASTHCLGLIIDAPFEEEGEEEDDSKVQAAAIFCQGLGAKEEVNRWRVATLLSCFCSGCSMWPRCLVDSLSQVTETRSRGSSSGGLLLGPLVLISLTAHPLFLSCSFFPYRLLLLSLLQHCPVVSPASCSCEWAMRERGLRKWKTAVRRVIERERRAGKRLNDALWACCCLFSKG